MSDKGYMVGDIGHWAEQAWLCLMQVDDIYQRNALSGLFLDRREVLEPLFGKTWERAQEVIEGAGADAGKRLAKGDYFWHPRCAECSRCRLHRPECRYDRDMGKHDSLCNRCADVMKQQKGE